MVLGVAIINSGFSGSLFVKPEIFIRDIQRMKQIVEDNICATLNTSN